MRWARGGGLRFATSGRHAGRARWKSFRRRRQPEFSLMFEENKSGLYILVVDDQLDCAENLASLLRLYGHTPEVVANGRAALAAVLSRQPDVILVDIRLPGMNGWELARRITAQATPKPFLIAVTGLAGEEAQRQSFASGIDCHLVKPVDPEQLESLLNQVQEGIDPHAARD